MSTEDEMRQRIAKVERERDALRLHLALTGDDAMRDILRQYVHENDMLAETALKLEAERDAFRHALENIAECGCSRDHIVAITALADFTPENG